MAFARRSLALNLTQLARRLHPSLPHLLLHDRDPDIPRTTHPPACSSTNGMVRDGKALPLPIPLGVDFCLRGYSSSSGGYSDEEFSKDDLFAENGVVDAVDSVTSAGNVVDNVGEVAAAAAESAPPVAALQHLIGAVHEFTGFNWWAAIAVTTLLIRSVTVPLMINQLKITAKLSKLRPELEELKAQLNSSIDPQVVLDNQKKMKELFIKHGVTPFSPLRGLFVQGPIFISFYFAIYNMVEKVPSFKEGGAFWFIDLTTPDPLYVLPGLTALSFLVTVELNMQEGMEGNPMADTMKKIFRVFSLSMLPLTAVFPKALFCYWISSNLFSLAYGTVLKSPPVRRFLNLPDVQQLTPTSQPTIPFWGRAKHVTPAASPSSLSSSEKSQTPGKPSSSAISQQIADLERVEKERNELKK